MVHLSDADITQTLVERDAKIESLEKVRKREAWSRHIVADLTGSHPGEERSKGGTPSSRMIQSAVSELCADTSQRARLEKDAEAAAALQERLRAEVEATRSP